MLDYTSIYEILSLEIDIKNCANPYHKTKTTINP